MNSQLDHLHLYPFEKLAVLLRGVVPPARLRHLDLAIGEPRHPVAPMIRQTMADGLESGIRRYPTTRGESRLRGAAATWLERRFQLTTGSVQPDRHLLPVNGTREALFSIALAVVNRQTPAAVVLMPNPFYQIYEGATLMAGADPFYLDTRRSNGFIPDYEALPEEILARTQLLYLCSPSNPTGSVHSLEQLIRLIQLADRYNFVLASDECYSEIWYDQVPPGLLQAAQAMGRPDFHRCLVFHSLSKRSNMPGARSGFVAGDGELLAGYFKLRTYTGCAMPPFIQEASVTAWNDEAHVEENRAQYQRKLNEALEILGPIIPVAAPQAGFYLWLAVPGGGEKFARRLFADYNVRVLPGAYLGRSFSGVNPGDDYVRIAMVASVEDNREAMERIAQCIANP